MDVQFLCLAAMSCILFSAADASQAGVRTSARRLSPNAPEVLLGDRLFFESRFSQRFASSRANINSTEFAGDPRFSFIDIPNRGKVPTPLPGKTVSCRSCHLGDDLNHLDPTAQRTYADFSSVSLVPLRSDGTTHTTRNSQQIVDVGLPREVPILLHFDGEFSSMEDLVRETLVGRNMGWLSNEHAQAAAHIARVLREDQGTNARHEIWANGEGIPYRDLLRATGADLPTHLIIPQEYRLDVSTSSDEEVLSKVARLISAYTDSLRFGAGDTLRAEEAPYDVFLRKNHLSLSPMRGETDRAYGKRLLRNLRELHEPRWVKQAVDGAFTLHNQEFRFGPEELRGLTIFLSETSRQGSAGNCIACHPPPQFTDHSLHNTGVSQFDYDAVHGSGAFGALSIPDIQERQANPQQHLPRTPLHPRATSRFRSQPSAEETGHADLGVWNIYANPDFPNPQRAITSILCPNPADDACPPEKLLALAIARFKTPTIRDLGHSSPYLHSGSANTIEQVLNFYLAASDLAKQGKLRNGASELSDLKLHKDDIPPLAAFLRSLNEDYH